MSRPLAGRRLLVLAGGTRRTASSRHRLWNYRPFLEGDGVALDWVQYEGGFDGPGWVNLPYRLRVGARLLARAGRQDVVVVQKVLPPAWLLRRWSRRGARVVYDFDDALFARAFSGEPEERTRRRRERFETVVRAADVVIAGSPPLADHVRGLARSVEVVYPSLDRESVVTPRPVATDEVTVGWLGNEKSQIYLKEIAPVLVGVLGAHPRARLAVCSSAAPDLGAEVNARMDFVPWSEEAEARSVAAFDIAISPLADDPWSLARGGRVSVLLSMAAGVPVVASPGGGIEELVGDGGGVLLAPDDQTFAAHLGRMIADPEEREAQGRRARAVIDERIWADVQYPRLREILFG